MVEIMTIGDFLNLPLSQQIEIQKALKTKERLETFLKNLNYRKHTEPEKAHWSKCKICNPEYPGWILKTPRDNSDVHPSQVTKCLKVLWYNCTGQDHLAEQYIDPRLQMIFDMGHAWHHTIQAYGDRGAWGDSYRAEVPIDPDEMDDEGNSTLPVASDLWIKGSADAVIDRYILPNVPTLGDVAVRVVHEYKTISSSGYNKLTRPKMEHKWQATIYSAVFDIPLAIYLYTNKDNCQLADFPVPFDRLLWEEIKAKIEKVKHYTNKGEPPPWAETSAVINPRECLECEFQKVCQPTKR